MERRKQLAHSIPHAYFVNEDNPVDYNRCTSIEDIESALAGSIFVWALIIGGIAAIFGSLILIAKCVKRIFS